MTNLIFGCGYLGQRVANRWLEQGQAVSALTRQRDDALRQRGIEPIRGDVLDPASLRALPEASTVLYAIGMDRSAGRSFRDVYVKERLLNWLGQRMIKGTRMPCAFGPNSGLKPRCHLPTRPVA